MVTAANELQALSLLSNLVPDTLLLETPVKPKAATVSCLVLNGIVSSDQLGLRPYEVSGDACDLQHVHTLGPAGTPFHTEFQRPV